METWAGEKRTRKIFLTKKRGSSTSVWQSWEVKPTKRTSLATLIWQLRWSKIAFDWSVRRGRKSSRIRQGKAIICKSSWSGGKLAHYRKTSGPKKINDQANLLHPISNFGFNHCHFTLYLCCKTSDWEKMKKKNIIIIMNYYFKFFWGKRKMTLKSL